MQSAFPSRARSAAIWAQATDLGLLRVKHQLRQQFADFRFPANQHRCYQTVPGGGNHRLQGMFILRGSHRYTALDRFGPEHFFHLLKIFQHTGHLILP